MATSSASICVLPISPTYSPTHRYLFYISLLVAILYPTPPPLVKGAFAFSLTYSATAALYAILILSDTPLPSSSPQIPTSNLDIAALNAILSLSAIAILPLQIWTTSLSKGAHNILRVWAVLITIGCCIAFTQLVRYKSLALSSTSTDTTINCHELAAGKLKLRSPLDAVILDFDRVFGHWYHVVVAQTSFLIFLPLIFGTLACFITVRAENYHGNDLEDTLNLNPATSHYGTLSGLSVTSSTTAELSYRKIFLSVQKFMLSLTPVCWIVIVVVNELYILDAGGLPEMESLREVGQWGVLAGLGFVAAAAWWNDAVNESGTTQISNVN